MIKTGLALDDKQLAEEARRMQLGEINTKKPSKKVKKDDEETKRLKLINAKSKSKQKQMSMPRTVATAAKKVVYFQNPKKIKERVNKYRKQCTLDHTET